MSDPELTELSQREGEDALRAAVSALIDSTELRDIRLLSMNAFAEPDMPKEITISFEGGKFGFVRIESRILLRFHHEITLVSVETDETVASIEVEHAAAFGLDETVEVDDATIGMWVATNGYFLIYPYVREAIHRVSTEFRLPPLLLGYLHRGERSPSTVSVGGEVMTMTTPDRDSAK